mmetsp:Transcript_71585/g.221376  ORF Transcript_71585/g.221376 Transcript_71585/m.221376 type:complete len:168 (+) Transcript_71585:40-543(+)
MQALNTLLRPLGTGIYHCGVAVYGVEWSYSDTETGHGDGIFSCEPQKCPDHSFAETVPLGGCVASEREVLWIVKVMKSSWTADAYDLLRRNCCHFCEELCTRLQVDEVPAWVTSSAGAVTAMGSTSGLMCCSGSRRSTSQCVVDVLPAPEEPVLMESFEPSVQLCVH